VQQVSLELLPHDHFRLASEQMMHAFGLVGEPYHLDERFFSYSSVSPPVREFGPADSRWFRGAMAVPGASRQLVSAMTVEASLLDVSYPTKLACFILL